MQQRQKKNIFQALKEFFIIPIIPRSVQEFGLTTFLINLNRMIKLLYMTMIGIVVIYFMMLMEYTHMSEALLLRWERVCLGIFLGVIGMLMLCYIARARIKKGYGQKLFKFQPLGCIFFLGIGLLLAYVEIQQLGNTGFYYITLILATTAFYTKPLATLFTVALAQAGVIAIMTYTPGIDFNIRNNVINTSICAVCLVMVSRLIYVGRVRGFINRREIVRKNQRLQKVNRQLIEANERLHDLYHTDQLTGIANRQQLYAFINQTLMELPGQRAGFGVWVMDIDNFKAYNDSLGHLEGDACLVWVAAELQMLAQKYNAFVARFGGEEFVMMRFPCSMEQMSIIGAEICAEIERKRRPHPAVERGIVTISVGGALETLHMEDVLLGRFIERADEALYRAKNEGRNRFVMAHNGYAPPM